MEEKTEIRNQLIQAGALLLKSRLPDYRDDYPKSVPKYIVDNFRAHNEVLRVTAIELRRLADKITDI